MKQTLKPLHTHFSCRLCRRSAVALAGFLIAHTAPAAITTWSGGGGDDNWSNNGNWDNGLPAGNDVIFSAVDATGTSGPAGTANQIVDANTTVSTFKFTNLQPGNHTTRIPTGVTLTVNGAGNHIEVQSPTTDPTDVVYATILGDGILAVNNTAATLYVGQGSATGNATRRATLDLSGLEEFSGTLGQIVVGRQPITSAPNRPQGTLRLARTNTLDLNSTGPGILLGSISSAGGSGIAQLLELGTSNTIRSDSGISIGSRKGNGYLRYNSETVALGAGSAVFRDLSGTGRQTNWRIGDNSGQASGSNSSVGVVDFSLYGGVDALVGDMVLGHATAGAATTTAFSQGTLTFDSGTIDTNSLTAGIQSNSTDPGNARGTVNVNGTGTLLVNGDVTLGRYFGTTYNSQGLINIGTISGGGAVTISGDVICGTGAGNKITLAAGSLTLGGKVGDDSVAGDAPLETLQLDGGTLAFDFGSAPNPAGSRVKVTNLNVPNTVTLNVSGSGLSPALPDIEHIKYTTFDEANQFANLDLVGLPSRVEAELVNNAANSSVDLNIISVSFNKWSGAINSDWDIDTTSNWALFPANTPSTYEQTGVPGEPVIFDDTAAGTKTVNLTTTLSPGAVSVDTAGTYTFNGSGAISGPTGIIKTGGGSLLIENTGTNDFTGGITIEAGKIQVGGDNDRLPVDATVTLADVATAELDLNNFNQTLLALNGGGTIGGNVQLGTGTLTLTGAGGFGGVINGSGSVVKSGTGNHVLSGANTFGGGTTITGGRITVTNASGSGLGSGPVQIEVGGELALGNGADPGGIAATTITNNGLFVINRSNDSTLTNEITGIGALTKAGDGALWIGSANSYGGLTTVNGGALRVTHPQALGAATDVAIDRTIINNSPGARLELSGGITLAEPLQLAQKQSIAGEAPGLLNVDGDNTLTGAITLGGGGSNWNVRSDAGNLTIAGTATNINTTNIRALRFFGAGNGEIQSVLADGAGTSLTAVIMNGTGTWRLVGDNTYSGATTVQTGTLQIDGNQTASTVTVNSSDPIPGTLAGTGTLGTVSATGTIAPGPGIGILNAATVTLSGTLAVDVSEASSDLLNVSGELNLTGASVAVSGTPMAATYILATAGSPIIGDPVLAPLIPGYELVVDNNLLKLNSTGNASPYQDWAGGAVFGDDENGDGVSNGLAFLLGAANPTENALDKLPAATQSGGGGLEFIFSMRNADNRGAATLDLQHSSDLNIEDAWTTAAVPDIEGISGPTNGVTFNVTLGSPLNSVQATIQSSEGSDGKLFGRLQAEENP